jgi:hypothetical protein
VPNPQWFPGDSAAGYKVSADPQIFTQAVTFQKAVQFQAGQYNSDPQPTSPGTVAPGGTVSNSLGYDAVVYASATTGIQSAKVGTVSIPGSVSGGNSADYIVPGGSTITLAYTGTLTWVWLAK